MNYPPLTRLDSVRGLICICRMLFRQTFVTQRRQPTGYSEDICLWFMSSINNNTLILENNFLINCMDISAAKFHTMHFTPWVTTETFGSMRDYPQFVPNLNDIQHRWALKALSILSGLGSLLIPFIKSSFAWEYEWAGEMAQLSLDYPLIDSQNGSIGWSLCENNHLGRTK